MRRLRRACAFAPEAFADSAEADSDPERGQEPIVLTPEEFERLRVFVETCVVWSGILFAVPACFWAFVELCFAVREWREHARKRGP